ncbi:AMIN-like domain-containing (lipo)protein [Nocardioides pacificus]
MRISRTHSVLPALVSLALLAPLSGSAVGAAGVVGAATNPAEAPRSAADVAAPDTPTLVGVRAFHRAGADRVVFRFDGGLPAIRRARYVDTVTADGSGRVLRVAGRARLLVWFDQAVAHDADGTTAPARTAYRLPNVLTTVRAGDFEAVTSYGIGLAKRTPYTISTRRNPSRVILKVQAGFPTVTRKVWFVDRDRVVSGHEPYAVARRREVLAMQPATGVMDRLYAGPTDAERADGLRLVRSRTTGFSSLRIANDIARIRLTGRCSSGGSTVTIADQIMPTLRQFPTVDWVKIYNAAGHTEDPFGPSDSIPVCLEP